MPSVTPQGKDNGSPLSLMSEVQEMEEGNSTKASMCNSRMMNARKLKFTGNSWINQQNKINHDKVIHYDLNCNNWNIFTFKEKQTSNTIM